MQHFSKARKFRIGEVAGEAEQNLPGSAFADPGKLLFEQIFIFFADFCQQKIAGQGIDQHHPGRTFSQQRAVVMKDIIQSRQRLFVLVKPEKIKEIPADCPPVLLFDDEIGSNFVVF